MYEKRMSEICEDLTEDFYLPSQIHSAKIKKLQDEYGPSCRTLYVPNRPRQSAEDRKCFCKIDEQSMNEIQEDLKEDFYSLAQIHSMEIKILLDEHRDEQMELSLLTIKMRETRPNM